jgi:hypothetical protein
VEIRRPAQEASIPLALCRITASEHIYGLQTRAKAWTGRVLQIFAEAEALDEEYPSTYDQRRTHNQPFGNM